MLKQFEQIGLHPADMLLPNTAYEPWAVIACDQYTSEKSYWETLDRTIASQPSTLRLILPEAYLEQEDVRQRIDNINQTMHAYINQKLFTHTGVGFVLVQRQVKSGVRVGLVGAIDLECYDYHKGATPMIRPTEDTIPDRIPPRLRIREHAPLELPHILVLIDDPEKTVIEPLLQKNCPVLYDFDLMEQGGHIKGSFVGSQHFDSIIMALAELQKKSDMLFAMGDGNHSLATAKAHWENIKANNPGVDLQNHPARYALAEIVNLHDEALSVLPIHRVVFEYKNSLEFFMDHGAVLTNSASYEEAVNLAQIITDTEHHAIAFCGSNRFGVIKLKATHLNPYGTLQPLLETFCKNSGVKLDYIHGDAAMMQFCKDGALGFFMPALRKDALFPSVQQYGPLPKKTFSLGDAQDKRYYLECKYIVEQ